MTITVGTILLLICVGWTLCCMLMLFIEPKFVPSIFERFNKFLYRNHWSKPFDLNEYIHYCHSPTVARYNTKTHQFQYYSGEWKDSNWCVGRPTYIKVTATEGDKITFNPYDYFDNPCKPKTNEIRMWELQFNFEYKKIQKEVKKICGG